MLGYWLRVLTWNLLPGRRLRRRSARPIRRAVSLAVAALEERTLATVAPFAPPASLSTHFAPAATDISTPPSDRAALDHLLRDLRQYEPPAPTTGAAPLQPTTPGFAADTGPADASGDAPLTSPPRVSVSPVQPAYTVTARASATDVPGPGVWTTPVSTAPVARPSAGSLPQAGPITATSPFAAAPPAAALATPPGTVNTPAFAPLGSGIGQAFALAPTTLVAPEPANVPAGFLPSAAPVPAAAPEPGPAALATPLPSAEATDAVLVQRFVLGRDQVAFDLLVRRHERFVFNVCRRVLGDVQVTEDAVQATFLVLARKAGGLDLHRPLASWLYTVAYHIALRLRALVARRRRTDLAAARERPAQLADEAAVELETLETHQVLREELQQLPDHYRVPLALCYFDGQTHAEAARTIGMPRGSIAKRIGEGLALLRARLTERGISL